MTDLPIPAGRIEQAIYLVRGHNVMLDEDLAELYGVETKTLTRAVKRNRDRFPEDFMFQLDKQEWDALRRQIGTSKPGGRGGRRYAPYAFTEHGVVMLSSVLRSPRALQVNIAVVRTFVHLRRMLASHEGLARKLGEIERKYDQQFQVVFDAIRELMAPPDKERRPIGFRRGSSKKGK